MTYGSMNEGIDVWIKVFALADKNSKLNGTCLTMQPRSKGANVCFFVFVLNKWKIAICLERSTG